MLVSSDPIYSSTLPYTTIIARYVEIGLKSRKVRSRMERRLLLYIQNICERENLTVLSATRNWGRLIFEFLPNEMAIALRVFQTLIGLHSYSPVLKIPIEFEAIKQESLKFSEQYLHENDSYAVRVKRFKSYFKNSLEIEREIGGLIMDHFTQEGKSLRVDLENPEKTIYLEIKEEYSYIFGEIFYTAWGGNPIENDKAMFSYWNGSKNCLPASFLLTRRGSVVTPVLFYDSEHGTSLQSLFTQDITSKTDIEILSSYYGDKLPVILLNLNPILAYFKESSLLATKKLSLETLSYCASLFIIDRLQKFSDLNAQLIHNRKKLFMKGNINSFHPQLSLKHEQTSVQLEFAQRLKLVQFYPLMGLNPEIIEKIRDSLMAGFTGLITSEFSLTSLIIDDSHFSHPEELPKSHIEDYDTLGQKRDDIISDSQNIQEMWTIFTSEDFSEIVEDICLNAVVLNVSKKSV